jgi:two-component system, cell cycle sensor histidine kinase and response regulator CckA
VRGGPKERDSNLSAARIVVGYAVISAFWISFSDAAVTHFGLNPAFSTIKGFAFIAVTGSLLYVTIKRLIDAVQLTSQERDETAELYRAVVEASGEGICLLDDFGRISFLNERMAAMVGRPADELQGKRLYDLVNESELLPQSTGPATQLESHQCVLRRENGEELCVLCSSTPLRHADRTGGRLAIFVDVTERKRLEEKLRQSQKMEALGRFAGGIAHDFNNLLSIMTGYSSLLEKDLAPDSKERNASREILDACERGVLLIRQLLAFSRRQPDVTEVVKACECVNQIGRVLPRMLRDDISVSIRCDDSTGSVRIGVGQIEQILMNLASNARDAMPHGGSLTIATKTVDVEKGAAWAQGAKPGPYVTIEVSDTGTGIDPSLKAQVFEPFFTTKPPGAGTGLGLSTVYGIVSQNGGFITCDSAVGVGTTFTIYLPLSETLEEEDETTPEQAAPAISGTETVLLVEDEPALRALTKHVLSSHGYTVLEAANSAEAFQLISNGQTHVDLLLTDVIMPGMSGLELADKITRAHPGILVVFISGYADVPEQLQDKGHFIQKPLAPDALLIRLRTILDHPSGVGNPAA